MLKVIVCHGMQVWNSQARPKIQLAAQILKKKDNFWIRKSHICKKAQEFHFRIFFFLHNQRHPALMSDLVSRVSQTVFLMQLACE